MLWVKIARDGILVTVRPSSVDLKNQGTQLLEIAF
jgi:hypothetical protein